MHDPTWMSWRALFAQPPMKSRLFRPAISHRRTTPRRAGARSAPSGHATGISQLLRDPVVADWLKNTSDGMNSNLRTLFLESTSIIAQILEMFGAVERARLPWGILFE